MNSLKKEKQFSHHYQNIVVVKWLQIVLDEIYLRGGGTITTDGLFIITNIGINYQIDASEFEGLFYTILVEEPSKNQRIHITEEKMIILYLIMFLSILVC